MGSWGKDLGFSRDPMEVPRGPEADRWDHGTDGSRPISSDSFLFCFVLLRSALFCSKRRCFIFFLFFRFPRRCFPLSARNNGYKPHLCKSITPGLAQKVLPRGFEQADLNRRV